MLLDPLHCYKKFIHAVGDHHRPRKNTRPLRTDSYRNPNSTTYKRHTVLKDIGSGDSVVEPL
jgi:hypothetical protein